MEITIKDVAKYAGVSKSTVSRVLNNSGPYSEITEKRVLDAVKSLDYKPNQIARSLTTKKTNSIGLIVPNINNPFYSKVCWHVERLLYSKNYKTIICNTNYNPEKEESYIEALKSNNVDGIISVSSESIKHLIDFYKISEIPIVVIDRKIDKVIPAVVLDNIYGGKLATEYLIKLGHKKIIFVTSHDTQAQRDRLEGYKMALKNYDINFKDEYVIVKSEEKWAKDSAEDLLKILQLDDFPTAIFTSNDYKAIKILNILRDNNYSVPEDISLIGYDDIEIASLLNLTTVKQSIEQMVSFALEKLFTNKNNEMTKILKPELIERGTTKSI